MMLTSTSKGNLAEDRALGFLKKKGLQLISRNFKIRSGEIDLIMRDDSNPDSTLVFVEVRYRIGNNYGSPAESITKSKVSRILRTAEYYLLQNPQFSDWACRFDVVSMTGNQSPEWIENAFTLE